MHIAHDTEHNFAYYISKIRLQNTYNKFRAHFLIAAFIIIGSMVFFAPCELYKLEAIFSKLYFFLDKWKVFKNRIENLPHP